MSVLDYVIGGILIILAVVVVAFVLLQEGKQKGLGSTIAGGGSENFLGKSRGKRRSLLLSKATTVLSIAFVVILLSLFFAQPNGNKIDYSILKKVDDSYTRTETTTDEDTTEDTEEEETEEETEGTTADGTGATTAEETDETTDESTEE